MICLSGPGSLSNPCTLSCGIRRQSTLQNAGGRAHRELIARLYIGPAGIYGLSRFLQSARVSSQLSSVPSPWWSMIFEGFIQSSKKKMGVFFIIQEKMGSFFLIIQKKLGSFFIIQKWGESLLTNHFFNVAPTRS